MFEPSSRYYNAPVATQVLVANDGSQRRVAYIRRRLIPDLAQQPVIAEHTVLQGERLDNIAALYHGDPLQFWRICDANGVLHPLELAETGRTLLVRLPRPEGAGNV